MAAERANNSAAVKGLWRHEFGGDARTVQSVFTRLRCMKERFAHREDTAQGLFAIEVPLPPADGGGFWRFVSIRDRIFCVVTEADYAQSRIEAVRDDGFVEFHFLMEGPVNLTLPGGGTSERPLNEATLIACRSAGDVNYQVQCPRGPFRMIGIYVDPDLLRDGYDFGSGTATRLFDPEPDSVAIFEKNLNLDVVRVVQDLRLTPVGSGRDLVRAAARIQDLICLSVDVLEERAVSDGASTFSQRELEMFQRAHGLLATDFSQSWTVTELARELGTNATKLKRGFKFLYGKTMFDFRRSYRMDHAMALLMKGGMSVAEVAREAGYERQASFTSAFKAHFGFLPRTARQAQRGPQPGSPD